MVVIMELHQFILYRWKSLNLIIPQILFPELFHSAAVN
jgi:hypothetical protein